MRARRGTEGRGGCWGRGIVIMEAWSVEGIGKEDRLAL